MTAHEAGHQFGDATNMIRNTLPADVERCVGSGSDAEGWRDGCDDCLRRLAPPAHPERVLRMTPPAIVAFWCEGHIPAGAADSEGGEA